MTHYGERIMPNHFRFLFMVIVAIACLPGCTTRAWYDGMQFSAKQSCERQPPSERERCEARLNKQDYDAYEKQRTQK
jgi:hypothetical protein